MAKLDYQYISSLVTRVQEGDSNAFAELYAATYQKQYYIAYKYLKDDYLAADALQQVYISALNNITTIHNPNLFVPWLNQLNFRTCVKLSHEQQSIDSDPESDYVNIGDQKYIVRQIMSLPFSESQAILLRYFNNLKLKEIADLLDCSTGTVRKNIISGRRRLKKLLNS